MDFGFARYDLNQITRRITLPEVSPDPAKPLTLIVRAATAGNRDFSNALFKFAKAYVPATAVDGASVAPAPAPDEAAARREIAALYAGASIVGWENAFEAGQPAPFTVELAQDLVEQLMVHVPDVWRTRVRDFVDNIANFRPTTPVVDAVDLGKG